MALVLVVDDNESSRGSFRDLLSRGGGHQVDVAASAAAAILKLQHQRFDVVLSDVRMEEERSGFTLLRAVKRSFVDIPVILYTGYADTHDAVLAGQRGAVDYFSFPVEPERIISSVATAALRASASPPKDADRVALRPPEIFHDMVAASAPMRSVIELIRRIGPTNAAVLITGETGTGKERVAQALHGCSKRSSHRFVPVNCSALPEALFEAGLFGAAKGAYTGAAADRGGLLEEADRGTIFLDEIGELKMSMQSTLLRFLEEGELRRLGENRVRAVDVRVIAATNRDLLQEIARERFRSDLFLPAACYRDSPAAAEETPGGA